MDISLVPRRGMIPYLSPFGMRWWRYLGCNVWCWLFSCWILRWSSWEVHHFVVWWRIGRWIVYISSYYGKIIPRIDRATPRMSQYIHSVSWQITIVLVRLGWTRVLYTCMPPSSTDGLVSCASVVCIVLCHWGRYFRHTYSSSGMWTSKAYQWGIRLR